MNYKGYELITSKDGKGTRTIAYKNNEPVYASYSEMEIDISSEEKCKNKIDGIRPSFAGPAKFDS